MAVRGQCGPEFLGIRVSVMAKGAERSARDGTDDSWRSLMAHVVTHEQRPDHDGKTSRDCGSGSSEICPPGQAMGAWSDRSPADSRAGDGGLRPYAACGLGASGPWMACMAITTTIWSIWVVSCARCGDLRSLVPVAGNFELLHSHSHVLAATLSRVHKGGLHLR